MDSLTVDNGATQLDEVCGEFITKHNAADILAKDALNIMDEQTHRNANIGNSCLNIVAVCFAFAYDRVE